MAAGFLFDEQLTCLRLANFLLQKLFNWLLQISFFFVFFIPQVSIIQGCLQSGLGWFDF